MVVKDSIYILEITAALVATFTYKWYKNKPDRIFMSYLWFVALTDISARVIKNMYHFNKDGMVIGFLRNFIPEAYLAQPLWLINLYDIVTYNLYLYYFYKLFRNRGYRQMLLLFLGLLWVSIVLNIFKVNSLFNETYLIWVICTGSVLLLICCGLYFFQELTSNSLVSMPGTLPFWILLGTIFFQLVLTPATIFSTKLFKWHGPVYDTILILSNFILYGCFITGFLVNAGIQKKRQRMDLTDSGLT